MVLCPKEGSSSNLTAASDRVVTSTSNSSVYTKSVTQTLASTPSTATSSSTTLTSPLPPLDSAIAITASALTRNSSTPSNPSNQELTFPTSTISGGSMNLSMPMSLSSFSDTITLTPTWTYSETPPQSQETTTNWAMAIEGDSKVPSSCNADCNKWFTWVELECVFAAMSFTSGTRLATPQITATSGSVATPQSFVASQQCECEKGILDAWKTCESCLLNSSATGNVTRIQEIDQDMSKFSANTTGTEEINWARILDDGGQPQSACQPTCNSVADTILGCVAAAQEDYTSSVVTHCACKGTVIATLKSCETCIDNSPSGEIKTANLDVSQFCGTTID